MCGSGLAASPFSITSRRLREIGDKIGVLIPAGRERRILLDKLLSNRASLVRRHVLEHRECRVQPAKKFSRRFTRQRVDSDFGREEATRSELDCLSVVLESGIEIVLEQVRERPIVEGIGPRRREFRRSGQQRLRGRCSRLARPRRALPGGVVRPRAAPTRHRRTSHFTVPATVRSSSSVSVRPCSSLNATVTFESVPSFAGIWYVPIVSRFFLYARMPSSSPRNWHSSSASFVTLTASRRSPRVRERCPACRALSDDSVGQRCRSAASKLEKTVFNNVTASAARFSSINACAVSNVCIPCGHRVALPEPEESSGCRRRSPRTYWRW